MNDPILVAALARGAVVVTPNKRLARDITARHDRAQVAAGRRTWPAARVLPWTTFVTELTASAQDAGLALPRQRLDTAQAAQLWQSIIERELADSPLLDASAAAILAAEAWERVHAWGAGGESWRGFADDGPDAAAFARWAEAFVRETAKLDAIDAARAPDAIAQVATSIPGASSLDIVAAGFLECSPQQQRVLEALVATGANFERCDLATQTTPSDNARLKRTATPRDELARALDWARRKATLDPAAQVGIVVLDLAERSALVRALAEDRLCAALQWPGCESESRPYDISVGAPLSSVPLVATALDLVTLVHQPLDRNRAATLLRSPYLPGSPDDRIARGTLEREWLERGVGKLALSRMIDAIDTVDAPLATRWRKARDACRVPARATPREWAECWRTWLGAAGWLEGRALDSAEFQAQGAWNELVAGFARLAAVAPTLSRDEALASLQRLARAQTFQPESAGARIRILGLLEATGLSFDALWVAGFAADAWPQAPSPNPLLPIVWQRERDVPRSNPARELAYARQLTTVLSHAAPEVVFSYAAQADDHERAASPLVASLQPLAIGDDDAPSSTAGRLFAGRPALDRVDDRLAPAFAPGARLPGGVWLIDAQSACPFQAAVRHRLHAEGWPCAVNGLTLRERGTLVHATLAALWHSLRDKASLDALSDAALDARIADAVASGCGALKPARWEAVPAAIAATEAECVAALVRTWLVDVERPRPAFTVVQTELDATVALAGYELKMRLDRVDALGAGGAAIIDYKTGKVAAPKKWFEPRPKAPQLALYAATYAQREDSAPVRALVYGRVRRGEVKAIGIGDSATTWPGLTLPVEIKGAALPDWPSARSRLDAAIVALATACGAGEASVAPRELAVCKSCDLPALCRIGTFAVRDADDAAENGDA